jgi:hypothetical protein
MICEKTLTNPEFRIEEKLIRIWTDFQEVNGGKVPLYQKEIPNNVITFLSLNPSYNKEFDFDFRETNHKAMFYEMIDCSKPSKCNHFKKFFEIGKFIKKEKWAAIDLLYIQSSNQKNIEKITDKNFIIQQMKITFEILAKINPMFVIVANRHVDFLVHTFSKELDLIIEQPCESNGNVYFINKMPFIIKESKFLGSRILWAKNNGYKEKLYEETIRILNQIQK